MKLYEKIKSMSLDEMAEFLRSKFDDEGGSIGVGIGCMNCANYMTHHYPEDCKRENCEELEIGTSFLKWLEKEVEDE